MNSTASIFELKGQTRCLADRRYKRFAQPLPIYGDLDAGAFLLQVHHDARVTSTPSACESLGHFGKRKSCGRPWASKLLPIDYEQCWSDQLDPPPKAGILLNYLISRTINAGFRLKSVVPTESAVSVETIPALRTH
jgi:hypothetical protein